MRESCKDCLFKHLGKAAVLMAEVKLGYPFHTIYVIGNLSEAEDEIVDEYPEVAKMIYNFRKRYMKGDKVNIDDLVERIYNIFE